MRFIGRRTSRLIVMSVIVLGAAAGIAYATIPAANKVYTACMLKNIGTIRLIDPTLPAPDLRSHCTALETQVTWNQEGQAGPPGPQGQEGPTGAGGPTGAPGPKGDTGVSGAAGPKGDTGDTGPQGATGPPGSIGATGAQGDTGAQGPAGPAGSGGSGGSGALWANVRSDGEILGHSTGMTASQVKTGVYLVTFPQNPAMCGINISSSGYLGAGVVGVNPNLVDPPDVSHDFFSVFEDISATNTMVVGERDTTGAFADGPFTITANCS
jgi:collagen triple helix repeat protein